jgi:glucose/arabinose dehydrogenase
MRSPSGFALRGDTVFIGTAQGIRAFLDYDKDGKADTSWIFFDDIPTSEHPYEWTCGLNFGPDGWLYFSLSSDSWNAGASPNPRGYRGAIIKVSPDGKSSEKVAKGIRSVYGISLNQHGDLFFTDNEGGGNSKEELNKLVNKAFYVHNPKKYTFDSITGPEFILQN